MQVLRALGFAILGAIVGIVVVAVACALWFEIVARTSPPNADLQPGSAWIQGAIFGGLVLGGYLAIPLGIAGFYMGLIPGRTR
jgi:hypothetical protein